VPEVRVIGADGGQVGILQTHEALRLAEEQGLDLVEVSPRAVPPVCRIMDFGRFKYQESKKEKASRKHQSTVVIKEIKFRPKTDTHDLDFKLKHIRRFLGEGNKVRLMIVFRGREIVHPETGHAMLDTVSKEVADVSVIEQKPLMEGRRMVMVLGPRSGVIRAAVPVGPSAAPGSPSPSPSPRPMVSQGVAPAAPATGTPPSDPSGTKV
jgi:translation initiation factor IF-3